MVVEAAIDERRNKAIDVVSYFSFNTKNDSKPD